MKIKKLCSSRNRTHNLWNWDKICQLGNGMLVINVPVFMNKHKIYILSTLLNTTRV